MIVKDMSIKLLHPYENNPRDNEGAVDAVAASIHEFGFKVPIVIDSNNVIIAGHTRYKASKKLGLETVPCIVADDLTPEQVKAFRVADNKTAELAEWDMELLENELAELQMMDFDMEQFGFEAFENDDDAEIVEDDVPEVDEESEPTVKLGDVWKLGKHRLMCGDSTSIDDVEKLMNGGKIDLLLTDPPYNMGYSGAGIIKETTKNVRERIKDIIDFNPYEISYISSLNIGSAYIFTSKDLIPDYFKIFDGWKFNILTWVKTNNPPMCNNNFLPDVEYMLYFHKGKGRVWNNGLRPLDIYRKAYFSSRQEGHAEVGDVHPTMKPLQLLCDKIQISSNENGIVLDIFGGSGSTLIACEQTNRNCFTMELDPKYCDVIIKRWETLTGEKAELIK